MFRLRQKSGTQIPSTFTGWVGQRFEVREEWGLGTRAAGQQVLLRALHLPSLPSHPSQYASQRAMRAHTHVVQSLSFTSAW